jgi:hypothetical protein
VEMNLAYFEATLVHLQTKGFVIQTQSDDHEQQGNLVFRRTTARCERGSDCCLSFETLSYANGDERFYLEIVKMGRMRGFSFPLDSWKYHANRIEFKYRDDPETGLGLALTIDLSDA